MDRGKKDKWLDTLLSVQLGLNRGRTETRGNKVGYYFRLYFFSLYVMETQSKLTRAKIKRKEKKNFLSCKCKVQGMGPASGRAESRVLVICPFLFLPVSFHVSFTLRPLQVYTVFAVLALKKREAILHLVPLSFHSHLHTFLPSWAHT